MSQILFIRHGPTEWNETGLIQGRSDIPLSEKGRQEVRRWTVPARFRALDWVSSPLRRARETARLLGAGECAVEPRLSEAEWGEWEGRNLRQLREELGEELARNEARGLDLTPPGGESPRQVRERLASWLAEAATAGRPIIAVTHNGVLRAAFSLATGWDMKSKPPLRREHGVAHLYRLHADGSLSVDEINIPLDPALAAKDPADTG